MELKAKEKNSHCPRHVTMGPMRASALSFLSHPLRPDATTPISPCVSFPRRPLTFFFYILGSSISVVPDSVTRVTQPRYSPTLLASRLTVLNVASTSAEPEKRNWMRGIHRRVVCGVSAQWPPHAGGNIPRTTVSQNHIYRYTRHTIGFTFTQCAAVDPTTIS